MRTWSGTDSLAATSTSRLCNWLRWASEVPRTRCRLHQCNVGFHPAKAGATHDYLVANTSAVYLAMY